MSTERFLLPSEACAWLRERHLHGRTTATLTQWRLQGTGPEWREIGGRVYYPLSGLEVWVQGCAGPTVDPHLEQAEQLARFLEALIREHGHALEDVVFLPHSTVRELLCPLLGVRSDRALALTLRRLFTLPSLSHVRRYRHGALGRGLLYTRTPWVGQRISRLGSPAR